MQDSNEKGKRMIAIVVPVYNAQKYIKQCIKSIQKQTLKNYKLILVDDGSEDLSGIICDNLAQKDQRIIVIHQENKGSVEARKTGVFSKQAQEADYICFVDADDTLEKDALEILYNTAKKYNADQVCADTRKSWKSIKINSRYKAPCFDIEGEKVYNQKDIIEKDLPIDMQSFKETALKITLDENSPKEKLVKSGNSLINDFIQTVIKKGLDRDKYGIFEGFTMHLTKEKILNNKEFYNKLFNTFHIDYLIK